MTSLAASMTDYVGPDSAADGAVIAPGPWPLAGVGAGIAALASVTFLNAPYITDEAVFRAGPEAVYAQLSGQLLTQLGAASGYLAAALLVPFTLGLVRTLARRTPDRLGLVFATGLTLVAGVATVVSAFAMKSVLASGLPGHGDNAFYTKVDTAVAYTISGQLQFAGFLPIIGAAGIVAVLVLKHRALQRWVGVFSALAAILVGVVTVAFNLPWSAGMVAPLWMIAVSVAAMRLRRRS